MDCLEIGRLYTVHVQGEMFKTMVAMSTISTGSLCMAYLAVSWWNRS